MAARQHVKLSSNVSIPLQGLDLAPFASESACLADGAVYDLYALANHSGSVDSGHYTAHAKVCRADETQPWRLFADDRVEEVCLSPAVSQGLCVCACNCRMALMNSLHLRPVCPLCITSQEHTCMKFHCLQVLVIE